MEKCRMCPKSVMRSETLLKNAESNECSRHDLMQFNLSSNPDNLICITLNNGILDENDVVMMIF